MSARLTARERWQRRRAELDRHYEQARHLGYSPRALGRDYLELQDMRFRANGTGVTVETHYLDGDPRTYLITDYACTCPARRECRHQRALALLGGVATVRRVLEVHDGA